MRFNIPLTYKVMPFQPASQIIPDVLGALLLIRRTIRENSAMTQRMYEAICQVLDHIYVLPIQDSDFIVPNEGIYERMDIRLRRVQRWVVQWPHRERIDDAFAHFRSVYQDFLVYVSNLQGEERRNMAQDYIDEFDEEFGSDSEDETDETDSVVTPPYLIQERSDAHPQPPFNSQRRNRN